MSRPMPPTDPPDRVIGLRGRADVKDPRALPVQFVRRLHQTIGNRAVAQLLQPARAPEPAPESRHRPVSSSPTHPTPWRRGLRRLWSLMFARRR
jgi:hypothetical protein